MYSLANVINYLYSVRCEKGACNCFLHTYIKYDQNGEEVFRKYKGFADIEPFIKYVENAYRRKVGDFDLELCRNYARRFNNFNKKVSRLHFIIVKCEKY